MMFEYADWWRRAKTWGEPADDVVAVEFTPNFVALKYDETGVASPFLQRSYVARRMVPGRDSIVDLHPQRYRHGGYIVFEKDDSSPSAMRRKYLFVVDVQKKSVIDNGQDIPIFIADHWSFVVNTNAKQQNKLNLHRTIYTPVTRHFGVRNSFHNPMPLQFDVPHTVDAFRKAFIRKPRLSEFSGWVRDILTSSLSPTSFGGGGSTWRRVKSQNKSVHSFDGLWQHLPLKSIFVIAIPCPEGPTGLFCVTVFVEHRLRPSSPTSECVSFAVNTDAEVVGNAQKLKKLVANLMKGMSWGDFADEPLPPGV